LTTGLYPFIPGDLLKIVLAAILLPSGWKLLGCAGLDADAARKKAAKQ
jgi:biotin transport system substrate-specific component